MMKWQVDLRMVMNQFKIRRQDFHRSQKNIHTMGVLIKQAVEFCAAQPDPVEWIPSVEDLTDLYTSHLEMFEKRPEGTKWTERFPNPTARARCFVRRVSESPESDSTLEFLTEELALPEHPTETGNFLASMKKMMNGGTGPDQDEFWNCWGGEKDV
jgi:hypothetical protein